MSGSRRFQIGPGILMIGLFSGGLAVAGEPYDADFSLRFAGALTRFSPYADVAAMANTSAANKWPSAINPGSLPWQHAPGKMRLCLAPQVSAILFDEGSDLYVGASTLTWESEHWGAFQPSGAVIRSNIHETRLGPDLRFNAEYLQFQWGIRPAEEWSIGANFNYTSSSLSFEEGPITFAESQMEAYDFRFGVLYSPVKRFRAGLVLDYGFADRETDLPFGVHEEDAPEQWLVRPGVAYEYAENSTVFLDYQFVYLMDASGELDLRRFSVGVEQQVFRGALVRGGMLVDATGHFTWTCGVGTSPMKTLSIDLAYQHDMFPEVARELGGSGVITLSVSISF